jgi:hypothetical protein
VDAYWTYTQAEADLEVRRHALGLAIELAHDIDRRVKVGDARPRRRERSARRRGRARRRSHPGRERRSISRLARCNTA